jgi:hypothetical protein
MSEKRKGGLKKNSTLNPKLIYSTEVDGVVFHMKGDRLMKIMADAMAKDIAEKYGTQKPIFETRNEADSDQA